MVFWYKDLTCQYRVRFKKYVRAVVVQLCLVLCFYLIILLKATLKIRGAFASNEIL